MLSRLERKRQWRLTQYAQFCIQRTNAKSRGVSWNLSYDEWKQLWDDSGHWLHRGTQLTDYCMCRNNDSGSYEIGNVRIDTVLSNKKEYGQLAKRNQNGQFNSVLRC